jgi:hypothetical protein
MALIPFGILSGAAGAPALVLAGYYPNVATTNTDKFAFPSETRSTLTSSFASERGSGVGASNSQVAGYAAGGSPTLNSIQKILFSNDTVSTISATLNGGRRQFAGMENHGVAGYFGTGFDGGSPGVTANMNKLSFPTDTHSNTTSSGVATYGSKAFANTGTAGYVAGGFDGGSRISHVSKFAFPADSRSTLATGLSVTVFQLAATENYQVAGYTMGGNNDSGPRVSTVNKFAFPSDTRSTLASGLSSARESVSGFAQKNVAGYGAGGWNGSSSVNTVDRFDFTNDTRTSLGTGLSAGASAEAGFENT